MFNSPAEVIEAFAARNYIATVDIATVLFLAQRLGKPVLAEGPAGTGKTELAKVWAAATGRPLIRLQCYEGLDETKALYEWEYAKQMLYTQLLRDKLADVLAETATLEEAVQQLAGEGSVFFSEEFLVPRPLLKVMLANEPSLLLIDEIDRADSDFEAFLLEVLSDFQVSVPELGTLTANHPPLVVLTSNNTRELSEALKRRCVYIYVDYPTAEAELNVVRLKVPNLAADLAQKSVAFVQDLRRMELKKQPSVSETLDWAEALVHLNARALDRNTLESTLSLLLKHQSDLAQVRQYVASSSSQEQTGSEQSGDQGLLSRFKLTG